MILKNIFKDNVMIIHSYLSIEQNFSAAMTVLLICVGAWLMHTKTPSGMDNATKLCRLPSLVANALQIEEEHNFKIVHRHTLLVVMPADEEVNASVWLLL